MEYDSFREFFLREMKDTLVQIFTLEMKGRRLYTSHQNRSLEWMTPLL